MIIMIMMIDCSSSYGHHSTDHQITNTVKYSLPSSSSSSFFFFIYFFLCFIPSLNFVYFFQFFFILFLSLFLSLLLSSSPSFLPTFLLSSLSLLISSSLLFTFKKTRKEINLLILLLLKEEVA